MLRVAIVALCVPVATAAFAAAWTLDRGATQTFIVSSFTYGDHGFDDNGKLISVPEYKKFELTGTMEYGVRPWLTAIGRAELQQETSSTYIPADPFVPRDEAWVTTTTAVGSVAGGARVRLHQGTVRGTAYVVSAEATASSGDVDTAGLGGATEGAGVEVRGLVGASRTVRDKPVFAGLEVGVKQYFDSDEDAEAKIDATVGVHLTPKWMVLAQSFTTVSLGGSPQNYTKVAGSVVRQVTPRQQVEVGAWRTVAGRNALQETGGRLGFWWRF